MQDVQRGVFVLTVLSLACYSCISKEDLLLAIRTTGLKSRSVADTPRLP